MTLDAKRLVSELEYKIERCTENITSLYLRKDPDNQLTFHMAVQKALMEFKSCIEDAIND